jgi:hypothetical protein
VQAAIMVLAELEFVYDLNFGNTVVQSSNEELPEDDHESDDKSAHCEGVGVLPRQVILCFIENVEQGGFYAAEKRKGKAPQECAAV